MKRHRLILACWVVLLLLPLLASSQQNLGRQTILQFDPGHSLLNAPAPVLEQSVPMSFGRSSSAFLGGVGGVSFDQVAGPDKKLEINQLSLNYSADKEDGHRLGLVINNSPVRVFLPDWLLAPIARYAESPYYSCVTLFGTLKDNNLQQVILDKKGRVINYHPDLENTLLGLRLLYMDMLIGYPFTTDLPKGADGSYLLGTGEPEPDVRANENGAYYLTRLFNSAESQTGEQFRSYVISDFNRKIEFRLEEDSLVISGFPYYYCWKFNNDRQGYNVQEVADRISAGYNSHIDSLRKASGNVAVNNYLIDKLVVLAGKYKGNYSFYQEGTFIDLLKIESDEEKATFLSKYAPEALFQMAVETTAYMDADSIIYLEKYSDLVSSEPELIKAMNPAVWNATVATMRYAAFFRYIKTNYPQEWLAFYSQVKDVDPFPRIVTPTIMYDPDSKTIEDAIKKSIK